MASGDDASDQEVNASDRVAGGDVWHSKQEANQSQTDQTVTEWMVQLSRGIVGTPNTADVFRSLAPLQSAHQIPLLETRRLASMLRGPESSVATFLRSLEASRTVTERMVQLSRGIVGTPNTADVFRSLAPVPPLAGDWMTGTSHEQGSPLTLDRTGLEIPRQDLEVVAEVTQDAAHQGQFELVTDDGRSSSFRTTATASGLIVASVFVPVGLVWLKTFHPDAADWIETALLWELGLIQAVVFYLLQRR